MNKNNNMIIKKNLALASENCLKNNFEVAKDLYNQILEVDPSHLQALNNLGVVFQELGKYQKAIRCYEKVIEINPGHLQALNNLGVEFQKLGKYQKAIRCYEKVIEINPNHLQALNNLGVIFKKLEKYQTAIRCYEKVIEIDPNHLQTLNNLGVVFQKLEENQKAISFYEKIIEIDPKNMNIHLILGSIFHELGKYQKAIRYYEKVIEIDPNHMQALNNLGSVFLELGEGKKALSFYEEALEIDPNSLGTLSNLSAMYTRDLNNFDKAINSSYKALKIYHKNSTFINQSTPLFQLKHDVQQAKYLSSKDYKIDGLTEFEKIGSKILSRKENEENKNNFDKNILLTKSEIDALLPFYQSDHVYKPKIISGSCINPNKNWLDIEDEYFNSPNQIMYIDDFLSDEALIELREFCLVSKVWNTLYQNKYIGAFSDKGFISSIHLQIAIDLKEKLPKLFGPHKIERFWGFKYDTTLGKGINIHADFALHNLNFWVTPDEYNNNKNSGGLKVYDAPAPDHWTFNDYNIKKDKIYDFLKENNAKCVNVPYKFNRAVLFNSAYFHETDEIDFKDEYVGRRINNTYLFGARLIKSKN